LKDLPEYGVFYTSHSNKKGLLIQWCYKSGVKWAAMVLLMPLKAGSGPIRKWMHSDVVVFVNKKDITINTRGRGDTGDAFDGRWIRKIDESKRKRFIESESEDI
jgi:hypothetical protein